MMLRYIYDTMRRHYAHQFMKMGFSRKYCAHFLFMCSSISCTVSNVWCDKKKLCSTNLCDHHLTHTIKLVLKKVTLWYIYTPRDMGLMPTGPHDTISACMYAKNYATHEKTTSRENDVVHSFIFTCLVFHAL